MKEIIISSNDAGTKLEKYLIKYFNNAPSSFTYKMLRKKNIKINGKNANGKEIISDKDVLQIYVSDDTILKFRNVSFADESCNVNGAYFEPDVIYEDDNILIINKPAGILSQKSKRDDYSINEICIDYLKRKGYEFNTDSGFRPSICNRLDRNTEGLMIFSKSYIAANEISRSLRLRDIHKYYYCVVVGRMSTEMQIDGYLSKNGDGNIVTVSDNKADDNTLIQTYIRPIYCGNKYSLLEIELITGKTHQIRAHLAHIGHPILGDYKYGNRSSNDILKKKYGINHQLLLSHKIEFPEYDNKLKNLSGKVISLEIPKLYKEIVYGNME